MVRFTLDRMADGGIRDQLGGGFHRYATDAHWLVPHFEQMLYDNAQLARAYLHAAAVVEGETGERYRDVAVGVLDYMLRELRRDDGAFAASQDADTEGIEGLTFTWRAPEIREVLGAEAARRSRRRTASPTTATGRTSRSCRGSGRAAMRRPRRPWRRRGRRCSSGVGLAPSPPATTRRWRPGTGWPSRRSPRPVGCSGRSGTRPRPCARGRRDRGRPARGRRLASAVVEGRPGGRGGRPRGLRHLADGLLALYETTFDERWFTLARGLADAILDRFADPAGGFFDTADDHERLITRPKDPQDNAVPVGRRDGDDGPAAAGGVHRRGPLPGRRGTGDRHGRAVPGPLPDRVRPVARGGGVRGRRCGGGRGRRRSGRARDPRAARAGLVDVAAVPGAARPLPPTSPAHPRSRCCTTGR